jgi:hypothetical protein
VALTGEEIRANLSRFAAHWTLYKGSERSGAQTFLNELLACYGTDLRESSATFEAPQEGRFLDFLWPGVCIVEMKAPVESKRLSHHRKQALDSWRESADARRGIPVPPFVVLCAMGVLTSVVHQTWAHSESSTLEDRPRYTPTTCFETFPWPEPDDAYRERIGQLAAELIAARQAITSRERIGLTVFYNALDEGAWQPVADLHRKLDREVLRAYGFPEALRDDPLELKARLASLNIDIKAGRRAYAPFA